MPLKETTYNSVEIPKPEIKVYSRRPKQIKSVGSSKKAKIVESKIANNSKPNHLWGSNATDVPSSSSPVNGMLSRLVSGIVRFRNDQVAKIMGYANLKVAFQKNTRYIRNLEGVNLLSRSRYTNLYTISLDDMIKTSPICLLSKASKTKSWLWHRWLSHLNFAPLFLWAEAINTACYTQNCSLIRLRYNKTPYELMHDKKPDLSFLHVFGSLCYPTNDSEDLGKLNAKADIGIFVGYAPAKKAFRIYNRRTHKIMETIHVTTRSKPYYSTTFSPPNRDDWDHFFQPMFDEYFNPPTIAVSLVLVAVAPRATLFEYLGSWTKDHPIENVIGDPSRSVSTRKQLETDAMWCYFDAFLTSVEPKNFKQEMIKLSWIDAMQEEIHEFERLQV
ncbi:retrovirus-related pol polyprotein from transposon TNT 1-94 [Tanacetum coccineum]|uniref:Retrovirus-related pol polyprotein from transposon TNT 1-94 n=1 Tax=Tanacetum coccineum TaxID=301880 RepID=A0ABQ5C8U3_9ASTR